MRVSKVTPQQEADAALSYRHDFGLLDEEQRSALCHQARFWLEAWMKILHPGISNDYVLEAALNEYHLSPPLETKEERLGRHAAIRGMMVRLGRYEIFCNRTSEPPAPSGNQVTLREALEPFLGFAVAESDPDIWMERICDWFEPSDFSNLMAAMMRMRPGPELPPSAALIRKNTILEVAYLLTCKRGPVDVPRTDKAILVDNALDDAIQDILDLTRDDPDAPLHADDIAVTEFAETMRSKLEKKRADGRGGWRDKGLCTGEDLSRMLREHVEKGDPVDVANFAMMLHMRRESIQ